jgi:hypothetical protein
VDNEVIKPSVKLMQSNIKLFKWHMRNVILNEENVILEASYEILF